MRIAVWRTGHEIADTVAESVAQGLNGDLYHVDDVCIDRIKAYHVHLYYGILRGTSWIGTYCAQEQIPYFILDRGYFRPSHYEGYYRVSLHGTQQTVGLDTLQPDYNRWRALGVEIMPWRGFDYSKPVLVCPPTEAVMQFFGVKDWTLNGDSKAVDYVIRHKGEPAPIDFNDYNYVLTFNSSVGWKAIAAGIPCVSNRQYSIVGAWFKNYQNLPENLSQAQYIERERLFSCMANLQLTLEEMRAGKLWDLMRRLMSSSVMTPARLCAPTLLRTV